jgi:hypothetical protein
MSRRKNNGPWEQEIREGGLSRFLGSFLGIGRHSEHIPPSRQRTGKKNAWGAAKHDPFTAKKVAEAQGQQAKEKGRDPFARYISKVERGHDPFAGGDPWKK